VATVDFTEALRNGIAPTEDIPRNAPFLRAATNFRCGSNGLKAVDPVEQWPTDGLLSGQGIAKSWPFPQLFRGREASYVMTGTGLWEFDEWAAGLTQKTPKDADDGGWDSDSPSNGSIPAGGPWHFIDFGGSVFFLNGSCIVWKTGHDANYWVCTDVTINTGCSHKDGRALFGGFNASDYWSSAWQSFWDNYDGNLPDEVKSYLDLTAGAGSNWVWWSSIGGGDLLWWFSKDLMIYGTREYIGSSPAVASGYNADNPFLFELIKRNQCGARPMPWQGSIRRILPLGQAVVVYGTEGIAILGAYSEPVATMGLLKSEPVGIAGQGAVAGDDSGHVFLSNAGELWRIEPDFRIHKLDYGHVFSAYPSSTPVVSYDAYNREFSICVGTAPAYILSEYGLTCGHQKPTNIQIAPDIGALSGPGNVGVLLPYTGSTLTLQTWEFDGGESGIWALEKVKISGRNLPSDLALQVRYKVDQGSSWHITSSMSFDSRGEVAPKVSGTSFEIKITGTDANHDAEVDRLLAEMGLTGKRSMNEWLTW